MIEMSDVSGRIAALSSCSGGRIWRGEENIEKKRRVPERCGGAYVDVDEAVLLHGQVGDIKAILLQDAARVEDALVLLNLVQVPGGEGVNAGAGRTKDGWPCHAPSAR